MTDGRTNRRTHRREGGNSGLDDYNAKNLTGEMVRYGKSRAKMPSRQKMVKRDWGKGMATAGRTKICTIVPPTHFGPIPGIEVGMGWQYRMQCAEAGVHRPPVSGIAGSEKNGGCVSIVLAGGYEDDVDNGDEFTYTGSGKIFVTAGR